VSGGFGDAELYFFGEALPLGDDLIVETSLGFVFAVEWEVVPLGFCMFGIKGLDFETRDFVVGDPVCLSGDGAVVGVLGLAELFVGLAPGTLALVVVAGDDFALVEPVGVCGLLV